MYQKDTIYNQLNLPGTNTLLKAYEILQWPGGDAIDLEGFLKDYLKDTGLYIDRVTEQLLTAIQRQYKNIHTEPSTYPYPKDNKGAPKTWMMIALTGSRKLIEIYSDEHPEFATSVKESKPYVYNPVYYAALSNNLEAVKFCVENLKIPVYPWDEILDSTQTKVSLPIREYLTQASIKTQQDEDKAKKKVELTRKDTLANASTYNRSKRHAEKLTKNFNPNSDNVAGQLAKIFHDYAHPGLFSLNWRHGSNQKVADQISKKLNKHPSWTLKECDSYIRSAIKPIEGKLNKWGTLQAVLDRVLPQQEVKDSEDETIQIVR